MNHNHHTGYDNGVGGQPAYEGGYNTGAVGNSGGLEHNKYADDKYNYDKQGGFDAEKGYDSTVYNTGEHIEMVDDGPKEYETQRSLKPRQISMIAIGGAIGESRWGRGDMWCGCGARCGVVWCGVVWCGCGCACCRGCRGAARRCKPPGSRRCKMARSLHNPPCMAGIVRVHAARCETLSPTTRSA